jgi:hypothetical protein
MSAARSLEVELSSPGIAQPRLAPGLLVAAPLFLAYEWGLATAGASVGRNGSEMLLGSALRALGERESLARWAVLLVVGGVAWFRVHRRGVELGREFLRTLGEAVVAAILLGPVLIGLVSLFEISPIAGDLGAGTIGAGAPPPAPSLPLASRLLGAAIWEELLFRVVCYALLYLVTVRLTRFFALTERVGVLLGDLVAILGSSCLFAAFHLELFTRPLGMGGEVFDSRIFLWRLLAGILLAGLFRWRGLGVAAWTHGLFNLALLLGADPEVFRAGA